MRGRAGAREAHGTLYKALASGYGYRDLADLQHKLVTETLGIARLHAILGCRWAG